MSATALLLSQYVPGRDLSVLQLNASNAISILLECQDALCANYGIPKVNNSSLETLRKTIIQRLGRVDPQYAIQVSAHVLELHLRDLELAKRAAKQLDGGSKVAIETLFLQAQSHTANGDFDAYLNQFSVQLWNTLMPGNLPDALIHSVLKPVLKYNIDLLATPWVLHSLIAETGTAQESSHSRLSISKLIRLLKKQGANDRNPYIRDLLYQLAPHSLVFGAIKVLLGPLGGLVPVIINRIVLNLSHDLKLPKSSIWRSKLSTYSSIMRAENHIPSQERQAWLRSQAILKVPKLFGTPILADDILDYRQVNRRLIVAILDLFLELLRRE